MSNLYLSSQVTSHKMLYDFMQSDHFEKDENGYYKDWTRFSVNEASLKKLRYLEEQNDEMAK